MASQDDDGLFDDLSGPVVPATMHDPPSDNDLQKMSMWEFPHLVKYVFPGGEGKKGLFCFWCNKTFKTGNAFNHTKALAHCARKKGHGVSLCNGPNPANWIQVYGNLFAEQQGQGC